MRIERDSMSSRQASANLHFGIETQRALENYPVNGLRANAQLIRAMCLIKRAAAISNRELKLIDLKRAATIIQAADEVVAGKFDDQFVVDVYLAGGCLVPYERKGGDRQPSDRDPRRGARRV